MSRLAQFSGLLGLSTAVHVALFFGVAQQGGAPAGAGGANAVTLAAVPPQMAALVETWSRPVQAQSETATLSAPLPDSPPDTAPPLTTPKPPQLGDLPLPMQSAQAEVAPPQAQAPAPPTPLAPPPPKLRPKPRPERGAPAPTPTPQRTAKPAAKPAPATPEPATPAQPAQRAAGSGSGSVAGAAQTQTSAAPSAAQISRLKAQWGGAIKRQILKRRRYPKGTRATGQVKLILTVSSVGKLVSVSIARSSGDAALDRAALKAARSARIPKAPKGLTGTHSFGLPINFER